MSLKVFFLVAIIISAVSAAASTCTPPAGKCCCSAVANDDPALATGVSTCATATGACTAAGSADIAATACAVGYQFATGVCTACTKGTSAAAGTTAACSICAQDKASTADGQDCISITGTATGINAIGCRVFGQAGATTCVQGQNGWTVTGTEASACAQGEYSTDGGACAALATADATAAAAVTALANCQSFSQSNPTTVAHCASAQEGFGILGGPGAGTAINACFAGCAVCTGIATATVADCVSVQAGYLFKGTTTKTIQQCDVGCHTCNWKAGTATAETEQECTKALAGYKLDTTTKKAIACTAGQGTTGVDGHAETACVKCTDGKNCRTCTQAALCSSCAAGYVPNATTATTCDKYDTTKGVHASCLLASGATDADCNTCDSAKNREIETEIVAPATTATPKIKGKCLCQVGFTEKATPDAECVACPPNAASCTQNKDLTFKVNTCASGFFLAGNACAAKTDSVAGFFWNTVPTTSKFEACHVSCKSCTAAGAAACVLCPDRPTTWVAPTESEANYETYLKAITNINNTCFSDCPTGWSANEDKTSCVEGSAGSASGIFSIILLIASVFMLI